MTPERRHRITTIVIIIAFIVLIGNVLFAQVPTIEANHPYYGIILKADTITVKKGFEHLEKIAGGRLWKYHRYVVKNDTTYIQFCLLKKVYRVEGKKYVRVKEYEL